MIINHSDTKNAIYDIKDDLYWDKNSLDSEINRVFDVCLGCRLCFNLCPSFPALFEAIDENKASDRNVTDLSESEKSKVVDLCYQCKLCDINCPYTPDKDHEFKLDFPRLMLRSQAIKTKSHGIKIQDLALMYTDLVGKIGALFGGILNYIHQIKLVRFIMHLFAGIHYKRILPQFSKQTFESWFKSRASTVQNPVDKIVIFGTCFTNSYDLALGKACVEVLEHNKVECKYPKQRCCGAPFLSSSDFKSFSKQSYYNIKELSKWVDKGYKIVVTGPPTCSLSLKKDYQEFNNNNEMIDKVTKNTYDISEYLYSLEKKGLLKKDFKNHIGDISYHVSCHLKAQKTGVKGKDLLKLVPQTNVKLVNRCSGMDGGWGMKSRFYEESIKVGEKCVSDLKNKDESTPCSDCSLACHQISEVSGGELSPTHPIIKLHEAYGLDKK